MCAVAAPLRRSTRTSNRYAHRTRSGSIYNWDTLPCFRNARTSYGCNPVTTMILFAGSALYFAWEKLNCCFLYDLNKKNTQFKI